MSFCDVVRCDVKVVKFDNHLQDQTKICQGKYSVNDK